jgi:calpain-15
LKNQGVVSADSDWYDDIDQGGLGDCYYLSALSSLAENPYRLKNALLTHSTNKAGAFATQIYVKGIPQVVVIDDYLPFNT